MPFSHKFNGADMADACAHHPLRGLSCELLEERGHSDEAGYDALVAVPLADWLDAMARNSRHEPESYDDAHKFWTAFVNGEGWLTDCGRFVRQVVNMAEELTPIDAPDWLTERALEILADPMFHEYAEIAGPGEVSRPYASIPAKERWKMACGLARTERRQAAETADRLLGDSTP